ncbi:MAG: multicopper oxidase domain-containing protein [Methylococcaceae bacterium]
MITRRTFIKSTAAGIGLAVFPRWAWPFSQSPILSKFVQALPGLGPTGIPIATRSATRWNNGAWLYDLEVGEFLHQFHPDLPYSKCWGYADNGGIHGYLGGVIVANKGDPVWIKLTNKLPPTHPLPLDTTIDGAEGPPNRVTLHMHGGLVDWTSDGGPFSWFTPDSTGPGPDGKGGDSFMNGKDVKGSVLTKGQALYYYPNNQSARMVWYHDHAMGTTRLNAYAGIASAFIIHDPAESQLVSRGMIPTGQYEIPLIIQDKTFVSDAAKSKGYPWGNVGDLWYPWEYEANPDRTGRWDYGPTVDPGGKWTTPPPYPSIVPEFFGDTIVINGAAYPYLQVEPRHYRFHILNGSQARFYNLQLYFENGNTGEANMATPTNLPKFIQIGSEGGFLPFPVALNNPPKPIIDDASQYTLLLAPAERADVIIDFTGLQVGTRLILYNDAPAPFPSGDDRNDYYTGDADQTINGGAPTTLQGQGPNTHTLIEFRVIDLNGQVDPPSMGLLEAAALSGNGNTAVNILKSSINTNLNPASAVKTRDLTLNEYFDDYGRLEQQLGTNQLQGVGFDGEPMFGLSYTDTATEVLNNWAVEIWRIYNLTGDTHPMHFHLFTPQVLSRQAFTLNSHESIENKVLTTTPGGSRPVDANEKGFKETIRMNPGEVTTIIMKVSIPWTPFTVPTSPRTGGYEYVWHCHILEHEEHDMMRPMVIKP